MSTGKSSRNGRTESDGMTSQQSVLWSGAIVTGGGCEPSTRSHVRAWNISCLPLHRSIPTRLTDIRLKDSAGLDLRFVSDKPPSTATWTWPSTVAPPMNIGEYKRMARLNLACVSLGVSTGGRTAGTKVLDGARRRCGPVVRRIGDVDPPLGGTVSPFGGVACAEESGARGPGVDSTDPSALPCNMLFEDLLSGMGVRLALPIIDRGLSRSLLSISEAASRRGRGDKV